MWSLMLAPFGWERSSISLHLSLECFLGTAPRLLMCTKGKSLGLRGPTKWFFLSSKFKASVITRGCSTAEGWLEDAEVHLAPL